MPKRQNERDESPIQAARAHRSPHLQLLRDMPHEFYLLQQTTRR